MLDYMWQMILKEFLQLRRDKHARFWLIVPTIAQMLVFGYATPKGRFLVVRLKLPVPAN
jgi:hypothetical protein